METINGYTVIAERPDPKWSGVRVILAVKEVSVSPTVFEYVTARTYTRTDDAPRHWYSGDYTLSLHDAVASFDDR